MPRSRFGSVARPKRLVSVLLNDEEADLLEASVMVLEVDQAEVLKRGLYLVGLTSQVLLGNGCVSLTAREVFGAGVEHVLAR